MIALLPILVAALCLTIYYVDKYMDGDVTIIPEQYGKYLKNTGWACFVWIVLSLLFMGRETNTYKVTDVEGQAVIVIDGQFINLNSTFKRNFADGDIVKISKNKEYSLFLWWPDMHSFKLEEPSIQC